MKSFYLPVPLSILISFVPYRNRCVVQYTTQLKNTQARATQQFIFNKKKIVILDVLLFSFSTAVYGFVTIYF